MPSRVPRSSPRSRGIASWPGWRCAIPGYGWEHNAGYATRDHVTGLRQLGLTPHHRRTYQRIRAILEGEQLAFDLAGEAIRVDGEGEDEAALQAVMSEG